MQNSKKPLTLKKIQTLIRSQANPEKARILSRFFKTAKGEYAEGDQFLGITVPLQRQIAKQIGRSSLETLEKLLHSKFHEERFLSLILLSHEFPSNDKAVFQLYCDNTSQVNNWDLVDESAPKIPGKYLFTRDRSILDRWIHSPSLWERRIAIVSTFAFLRLGDFSDTLQLAKLVLKDQHDLIHKASGWMVREVYKRNPKLAMDWILEHKTQMPRTMLRYAIEKVPEKQRKQILLNSQTK